MEQSKILALMTTLKNSRDFKERIQAVRELAKLKSSVVVEPLLFALADHDDDVRIEVVKALASQNDSTVAGRISNLLFDSVPNVRIEAVKALFELKSVSHIPQIFQKLDDPDWSVKNIAAKMLGKFTDFIMDKDDGNDVGVQLLISMLRTDEISVKDKIESRFLESKTKYLDKLWETLEKGSENQKLTVCSILSKLGYKESVFPLINILDDTSRDVRKAAIISLGILRDNEAIRPLLRSLGDANAEVRKTTVRTLTRFGKDAVLPLVRALIMSRDPHIRRNVAITLGEIGDQRAISALLATLGDSYFLVRDAVVTALTKFGPSIENRLTKLLTPSEHDLELPFQFIESPLVNERLKGIELLHDYKDTRSVKALQKMLADPSPLVQEKAQNVLSTLGCNAWARAGAARLLGILRIKQAIPVLIFAVDDVDKDVRIEAIHSLGLLRAPESVQTLSDKLKETLPEIRSMAAHSLGSIGDVTSLENLIQTLDDDSSDVRIEVITAMGKLLDPNAVLPLLNLFCKSNYREKDIISNALKTIGKQGIPLILQKMEEQDPCVVEAVEQVLSFMKNDFSDAMIEEILPSLSGTQKKYFLTAIGKSDK